MGKDAEVISQDDVHDRVADGVNVDAVSMDAPLARKRSGRNWTSLAVVPAAWFGHVAALGIVYSFGVLVPAMLEEWPYSTAGELGLLGSALTGAFFGVSILVGKAVVRVGHRRAALFGACLVMTGWLMVFFAQRPWQAYPGIAVLGFGLNFVWAPGLALLPAHFPNNKATASGIAVTGSGFGSLFWSWTMSTLIEEFGLKTTILILAALNGSFSFMAACGYAPVPRKPETASVVQEGAMIRDDKSPQAPNTQMVGKAHIDVETPENHSPIEELKPKPEMSTEVDRVVPLSRDPVYYALCLATFSSCLGFMAPFTHVATYSTELGCGDDVGASAYMVFGAFSIIGRLLAGPLGDRFGALVVWASGMPLCAGALLWLGFATSCNHILGSMSLFGLFSGPVIALMAPLLVELFGLARLPLALGPILQMNGLASMLAPAIAGHARDWTSSYTISFTLASAFMFNASGIMVLVRSLHSRRHECTKPVPSCRK